MIQWILDHLSNEDLQFYGFMFLYGIFVAILLVALITVFWMIRGFYA